MRDHMTWLLVLILLAVVVGVGTLLEAALWVLLIIAAVVAVGALGIGRLLGGGSRAGAA
jgi:hypothetical protein